jgi:Flp pilus assembly protein protease CpaA
VGGVLALGVLGYRAVRNRIRKPVEREMTEEEKQAAESIPYAPAIALGVWLTLVPRG